MDEPKTDDGPLPIVSAKEAADPEVGLILLDVVLGDGAHPDPAGELAPAISEARMARDVEFVAVVIGTDEDLQNLESQVEALKGAGASAILVLPVEKMLA